MPAITYVRSFEPQAFLKRSRTVVPSARVPEPVSYPDSDGEPMAESDFQADPLTYLRAALKEYFHSHPNVYVSGNLLIYYEEGNPRRSVAPDIFVVRNVPNHPRDTYKVWEEGKAPDVVIEVTSRTTQQTDEKDKPKLYRRLGIQEYFQYDPKGEYLKPALKGRRLNAQGRYKKIEPVSGIDGSLRLQSTVLGGMEFRLEQGNLRLFDPSSGRYLFTYSEALAAYQVERQQKELLARHLRALGVNPDDLLKPWQKR